VSPIALCALIFAIMLGLMAIRTPIAISMFIAGCVGYVLQSGLAPLESFLNSQAFARFASYDLSVIPLFILMGHFATQGGISRSLFEFTAAVVGRLRGGLAMAAVMASAAFGAICGSSVATAATITGVALPEMNMAMAIGVRSAISANITTIIRMARETPVMRSPRGGPARRRNRRRPASAR
jgi:TRAP-type mannitol/chloroaromatic compound transport system permease large subunit